MKQDQASDLNRNKIMKTLLFQLKAMSTGTHKLKSEPELKRIVSAPQPCPVILIHEKGTSSSSRSKAFLWAVGRSLVAAGWLKGGRLGAQAVGFGRLESQHHLGAKQQELNVFLALLPSEQLPSYGTYLYFFFSISIILARLFQNPIFFLPVSTSLPSSTFSRFKLYKYDKF